MGYKAMVSNSTEHAELESKLRLFIKELQQAISPFTPSDHLRLTLFSDTSFAVTDAATHHCFRLIVRTVAIVMQLCKKIQLSNKWMYCDGHLNIR